MCAKGRVLIVQGAEDACRLLGDVLRLEGHSCDTAGDVSAARKLLGENSYDLLIADADMPGNASLEFVREVPGIHPGTPVILTTGHPTVEAATEAIRLSAAAYMTKPVDLNQLVELAARCVERSQACKGIASLSSRLDSWSQELQVLREAAAGPCQAAPVSMDTFLRLAFRNIGGALLNVQGLVEASLQKTPGRATCHLLDCPRLAAMTGVLRDAINVLEKTRHAFKSKELGDLRARLEAVVKN
jgi:DNA-binding response OmpR family regulator